MAVDSRIDFFAAKAAALGATLVRVADDDQISPAAEDVVCRAELGVAETGSVLVCLSNAERGRAMLAERLWLLVNARDVVASLDEALQRAQQLIADGNHYATFMSGPSRTADIERTLTIGVHGPRALTIAVIGEPRA